MCDKLIVICSMYDMLDMGRKALCYGPEGEYVMGRKALYCGP